MASINYQILIEMRDNIVGYLDAEKKICEDALKAYEPGAIIDNSEEIRVMREREAIKLRDRIYELNRHISVIKAMYPNK